MWSGRFGAAGTAERSRDRDTASRNPVTEEKFCRTAELTREEEEGGAGGQRVDALRAD